MDTLGSQPVNHLELRSDIAIEVKPMRDWSEKDLKGIHQEHYMVAKSFDGPFTVTEFRSKYRQMYPSRSEGSHLVYRIRGRATKESTQSGLDA